MTQGSPSTKNSASSTGSAADVDWRAAGLRYFAYNLFLRRKFGHRVQRVSVDAGLSCPNVDGTLATGGCVYCENRSFSPSRRLSQRPIGQQIDEGIRRMQARYGCEHFLAYFQPSSNTYAPVERLRELYEQALAHPRIIGLAVGTRPDCVPDDVLDLLAELARRTFVSVEYGMQTMHDRSLAWMNRGHRHAAFVDAMQRSRGRGFEICAHLIVGLPGESREDILASAAELVHWQVDAVKIHNLYAVRDTPLADLVQRGEVRLLERDEYLETLIAILERLPPRMVIERISGDAPREYFVAPTWCLDKAAVRAALEAELRRRDTWQGKQYSPNDPPEAHAPQTPTSA